MLIDKKKTREIIRVKVKVSKQESKSQVEIQKYTPFWDSFRRQCIHFTQPNSCLKKLGNDDFGVQHTGVRPRQRAAGECGKGGNYDELAFQIAWESCLAGVKFQ